MTSEFADNVFKYLYDANTPERSNALKDLAARGAFAAQKENRAKDIVQRYVEENPRGFCDDGVRRFLEGVNLDSHRVGVITIEVTTPLAWTGDIRDESHQMFTADSVVYSRLVEALVQDYGRGSERGMFEFKTAKILSCKWAK